MGKSISFLILIARKILNNNALFVLICLMMIFSFTGVSAQKAVTGKVTDNSGASLPGVSVVVKGTTTGTITNEKGIFSLSNIPENATLQFSFVGMTTQEILVGSKNSFNVVLAEQIIGVEEVVAIGYGSQKKVDIIGAVGRVKAEKLEAIPATNLSEALAGRMSGVFVDQSSGVPGISSNLIIRSASSWNDSPPLYVIDGVVLDKSYFDRLSSYDIEDISILKDAASASIYGSRATGGVVLVTTKKGSVGKPVITYDVSYSFQKPTSTMETLTPEEAVKFINSAPGPDYLKWDADEAASLKKTGIYHWLDYVDQTPTTVKHSLNVSGGNKNVKYFLGGNYLDNKGFLQNLGYKKYSVRGNVEANINDNLTATLNFSTGYDQKYQPNQGYIYDDQNDDLVNLYGWLYSWPSSFPPYINGKPVNDHWNGNYVERVKNGGYNRKSNQNTDVLVSLNYKIPVVPGLSVKGSYSLNSNLTNQRIFDKKTTLYDFYRLGSGSRIVTDSIIGVGLSPDPQIQKLSNYYGNSKSYQLNGQINYNRDFGQHHVDAFAVYEQYENTFDNIYVNHNNFSIVVTDQFNATSKDPVDQSSTGKQYEEARVSYVGKVNYSYASRYYLSASIRRDGSTKFGPDYRWGTFPAIYGAWRISDESFFKDNITFIQSLKLRTSYGLTGNDNVGGWLWQEQYGFGRGIYFGNSLQPSLQYPNIPVANLTWEKSKSYNYGIDVVVLNNLSIAAEYWTRNTYDILGPVEKLLPSSFGGSLPSSNYGKVDSHGLELEIGYEGKTAIGLNYHIRGNFSYAINNVIKKDYAVGASDAYNPNGKPTNYIVGLVNTGIIRTKADLDKLPAGYTVYGVDPSLGSLSFKDISGPTGIPDGKIDDYDKDVLSMNGIAPYTGGLTLGATWKGISLEAFFQGSFGQKKLYYDLQGRQADLYDIPWKHWKDSWSPENINAKYPRAYEPGNDLSFMNYDSDFWLFEASYVRLKQLSLDYIIPQTITKKVGINQLRINLTGTNLLTWSKWKLYDPQLRSYATYPIMKTFTMGITLTL